METAILVFTKDADMLTLKQQIAALMREYGGENNCQVIENPGEMDYGVVDNVANDCNLQKFDNFLVLEDPAKFTVLDDAMAEEYDGMFLECRAIPEQFRRFTEQDTSTLQNNGVPPVTKPVGNPQQGQNTNENQNANQDQNQQQQQVQKPAKFIVLNPSYPTVTALQNLMNVKNAAQSKQYNFARSEALSEEFQLPEQVWQSIGKHPLYEKFTSVAKTPEHYLDARTLKGLQMSLTNLVSNPSSGIVFNTETPIEVCLPNNKGGDIPASFTLTVGNNNYTVNTTNYGQVYNTPTLAKLGENKTIYSYLEEAKKLRDNGAEKLRKKQWIEGEEQIFESESKIIGFLNALIEQITVFKQQYNRQTQSINQMMKNDENEKSLFVKAVDYVVKDMYATAQRVTNQGMGGDNFLGDMVNLAGKAAGAVKKKMQYNKNKDKAEARALGKKSKEQLQHIQIFEYEHYSDLVKYFTGQPSKKKGKTSVEDLSDNGELNNLANTEEK